MAKAILFDLDGTLTESGEGIMKSATLAFETLGYPVPDSIALRAFIGPPLQDSFRRFGIPEELVEEAVRVFRSRYLTVGKFENKPYAGIVDVLKSLKSQGHILCVATSKIEHTSLEILDHFGLTGYFDIVCGGTADKSRKEKADVIAHILPQLPPVEQIIMVGDTIFDIEGAAALNIPAIGVAWGYGDLEQMRQAGAMGIAGTMEELLELLTK